MKYEEQQDALPLHERDGYAERMYEQADMLRKTKKVNNWESSIKDEQRYPHSHPPGN